MKIKIPAVSTAIFLVLYIIFMFFIINCPPWNCQTEGYAVFLLTFPMSLFAFVFTPLNLTPISESMILFLLGMLQYGALGYVVGKLIEWKRKH